MHLLNIDILSSDRVISLIGKKSALPECLQVCIGFGKSVAISLKINLESKLLQTLKAFPAKKYTPA